jgi:hypothetical protein
MAPSFRDLAAKINPEGSGLAQRDQLARIAEFEHVGLGFSE